MGRGGLAMLKNLNLLLSAMGNHSRFLISKSYLDLREVAMGIEWRQTERGPV